jgi:hypothetical protein
MATKLQQACTEAVELLNELSKNGQTPSLGLLRSCDGVMFTWAFKAGLVVGLQRGRGFFIRRLAGGKWSAPLFLALTSARAGMIAGAAQVNGQHDQLRAHTYCAPKLATACCLLLGGSCRVTLLGVTKKSKKRRVHADVCTRSPRRSTQ